MTLNSSTGVLSGTPAAGTAGTYPITLKAANNVAPDATQSFTLTVNQVPAITSANSTTFAVGSAGTFTVTATGSPAPTFSETGALPTGVTLNGSTGVLSGTPGAGTGGLYKITLTASNGVSPDATQAFSLTVTAPPAPPVITSGNSATFDVGTAGTFDVTATGYPIPTYTESGALPTGVTLATDGVLSGTPAAGTGGAYSFTITATNGNAPDASQPFTLTVNQAPALTSAASTTFIEGQAGTFHVTSTGHPAPAITETGALPSGVTLVDNGNGTALLSGTRRPAPAAPTRSPSGRLDGVSPDATQSFVLTVATAPRAPSMPGAIPGDAKATVSWVPGGNGGSPILSYSVTSTALERRVHGQRPGHELHGDRADQRRRRTPSR